jgi:large subunit ribosomal protein L4
MKASVHNLKGEKVKDIEISEGIFGLKRNDALLHQVYVAQYANRRKVLAHTKDRAERAGSGIKPWKQKGTGRARVGSVRSPIWRKGGVTFGPTKDRNFKKDIPKKMGKKALAIALSGKLKDSELVLVESLKMDEPKTKLMKQAAVDLKLKGSTLIGFSKAETETKKASRNLKKVTNIDIENLNVLDILNHKYFVMSEEGVKVLENRFKKR